MTFRDMRWLLLIFVLLLTACGGTMDDLAPSGADKRPAVQCGITGPSVCQYAPDFTLSDTLGNSVTLSTLLSSSQGVVIYFTMWCPVCDTHMSDMRSVVLPAYPNVRFLVIDYVSGSVDAARNAEIASGYAGSGFTVLADTHQDVLNLYDGTMGTTVVIDASGVIRMNEDYKDGSRLRAALASLP